MPPQPPPAPFVATYQVAWHGITAGESVLTLSTEPSGTFTYSSNIKAHGIFRLVFPDALIQSSTFTLSDGHVAPVQYQESGQARDHSEDVNLIFDRGSGRVHGTAETRAVDSAGRWHPGSHVGADRTDAATAGRPRPYAVKLFDKDQAKEYFYTREHSEVLMTPLARWIPWCIAVTGPDPIA